MSNPRATIQPITIPLFARRLGQGHVGPDKWAIIFHTSAGREEFGTYPTKAAARTDAKKYDITLTPGVILS